MFNSPRREFVELDIEIINNVTKNFETPTKPTPISTKNSIFNTENGEKTPTNSNFYNFATPKNSIFNKDYSLEPFTTTSPSKNSFVENKSKNNIFNQKYSLSEPFSENSANQSTHSASFTIKTFENVSVQSNKPSASSFSLLSTQNSFNSIGATSGNLTGNENISSDFDLTFLPTAQNYLGSGRYAKVFKASYILPSSSTPLQTYPCAVKQIEQNTEAQAVGLAEIYVLKKISLCHSLGGNTHNLIRFIGVKDDNNDINPEKLKTDILSEISKLTSNIDKSPFYNHYSLLTVLEYCEYGSLWDFCKENREKVNRRQWIKWGIQISGAVKLIHSLGIIHHDIKPQNILLDGSMESKLADFGNSTIEENILNDRINSLKSVNIELDNPLSPETKLEKTIEYPSSRALGRGTDVYVAPEIYEPQTNYTNSIDIYSLALTLFVIGPGFLISPFQVTENPSSPYDRDSGSSFQNSGQHLNSGQFLSATPANKRLSGVHLIMFIKRGFWKWVELEFEDKQSLQTMSLNRDGKLVQAQKFHQISNAPVLMAGGMILSPMTPTEYPDPPISKKGIQSRIANIFRGKEKPVDENGDLNENSKKLLRRRSSSPTASKLDIPTYPDDGQSVNNLSSGERRGSAGVLTSPRGPGSIFRFLNGEIVDLEIINLLRLCSLKIEDGKRPSARSLQRALKSLL